MTVIQLASALESVSKKRSATEFSVAPLNHMDTFNLYQLKCRAEELFEDHRIQMEKFGYRVTYHLDFISLCEEINSASLDAYMKKSPASLSAPMARDLMFGLKTLKNYLQNAHYNPLHDQELRLQRELKSIQNVVSLRETPDKQSIEIRNSVALYQYTKSEREDFGVYLEIIRDIYLKVLDYNNRAPAPVEHLFPSRELF